mmetsp:Transcript_3125/g.10579  ORF Transcript_3125/g.10579 Transcript_3125/m.10579 type:complete len:513 (-) Transcript_3125:114-1652(-)
MQAAGSPLTVVPLTPQRLQWLLTGDCDRRRFLRAIQRYVAPRGGRECVLRVDWRAQLVELEMRSSRRSLTSPSATPAQRFASFSPILAHSERAGHIATGDALAAPAVCAALSAVLQPLLPRDSRRVAVDLKPIHGLPAASASPMANAPRLLLLWAELPPPGGAFPEDVFPASAPVLDPSALDQGAGAPKGPAPENRPGPENQPGPEKGPAEKEPGAGNKCGPQEGPASENRPGPKEEPWLAPSPPDSGCPARALCSGCKRPPTPRHARPASQGFRLAGTVGTGTGGAADAYPTSTRTQARKDASSPRSIGDSRSGAGADRMARAQPHLPPGPHTARGPCRSRPASAEAAPWVWSGGAAPFRCSKLFQCAACAQLDRRELAHVLTPALQPWRPPALGFFARPRPFTAGPGLFTAGPSILIAGTGRPSSASLPRSVARGSLQLRRGGPAALASAGLRPSGLAACDGASLQPQFGRASSETLLCMQCAAKRRAGTREPAPMLQSALEVAGASPAA